MRKTIYHDVTQLVHWSGKITGIPRVMNELALRARQANPDEVFVSWVKEVRAFCEIDLDKTLAYRGHGIVFLDANTITDSTVSMTANPVRPGITHKLKKGVKRVAKAGLRRVDGIHPGLHRRLESRIYGVAARRHKQADIRADDTVFITWGEWWDDAYLAMLEGLHSDGTHITTVIHDVGPMAAPHLASNSSSLADYCRRIVPICKMVFCVSQNTVNDLSAWLQKQNCDVPPMTVIRLGEDFPVGQPTRPAHESFAKSGIKGNDYIMCMGTVELKKNHMLLYYAYKLAAERGIALPKLVIAGRRGWMTEATFELIAKDPQINQQIVFVEQPSDDELAWLYLHCMFTVLPSYYEGWGIPVAESLHYGVPCICSGTSSMVEIGEGIVKHFSPSSTDECLAAIVAWLDPKTFAAVKKKTLAYKPTIWDDTYKQIALELEKL